MSDLVAFLTARVDEVETAALAAGEDDTAREWTAPDSSDPDNWASGRAVEDGYGSPVVYDEGAPTPQQTEHIALNDPARVLHEVEANRSLLANFEEISQPEPGDSPQERANRMATAEVVRMLILDRARVYSDHPDFRQEWSR